MNFLWLLLLINLYMNCYLPNRFRTNHLHHLHRNRFLHYLFVVLHFNHYYPIDYPNLRHDINLKSNHFIMIFLLLQLYLIINFLHFQKVLTLRQYLLLILHREFLAYNYINLSFYECLKLRKVLVVLWRERFQTN